MHDKTMFLSKDKLYLTDEHGHNMAERIMMDSNPYYRTIGIESEAYDNTCLETKLLIVCTLWDAQHKCLTWDEVDVCVRSELVPHAVAI
jgi:hypothetical protein